MSHLTSRRLWFRHAAGAGLVVLLALAALLAAPLAPPTLAAGCAGVISLAAQQTFAAGSGPRSIALGDLNGDGRPDLATANESGAGVNVLLNTTAPGASSPAFAARQFFATGSQAGSVALGDLNGDGRPDLAVASWNSATVSVLLNTTAPGVASPAFAAPQAFATGSSSSSVALGDLNGDGRPDLATANLTSNSVSVLLNTTAPGAASPSFAAQQAFATGGGPYSVALGDLNGDGRPDLAVANLNSNNVSVLLNTTTPGATSPTFAAQQTFTTGSQPAFVALGDLNGDGRPDLAAANFNSATASVLLNTTAPGAASATFAAQQPFATDANPRSVALGDLDGDGRPDLAIANQGSNSVSVLLNTTAPGAASPSFAAQQAFATGAGPISVALGDLNGDGRPDLAIANFNNASPNVSVLLNTSAPGALSPAFAVQQTFPTNGIPTAVALGDLNGDGRPDLAVANNASSNSVSVLLNTTTPGASDSTFAAPQSFAVGSAPAAVALGDLNGDGRPDLTVANLSSNSVSVLLNTTAPGAASPAFAAQQTFATGRGPYSVALGDLNGDGRLDLAVANYNSNNVSVLLNSAAPGAASPSFADQQAFATGRQPNSLAIDDLNGDGWPDLATANYNSNNVSVLLNTTAPGAASPAFANPQAFPTDASPSSVALGDLNGDGRLDLATANYNSNNVSVLLNTTAPGASSPAFANPQAYPTDASPSSMALGDLNGDGRPDLATANDASNSVSVLLNQAAVTSLAVSAPASVTAGTPFALSVTARDGCGATVAGYTGTVAFTSSDASSAIGLPANAPFLLADSGVKSFSGLLLRTAGSQTITVTDTGTGAGIGSATITVNPGAPSVTTGAAGAITGSGATLTGTVNANSAATSALYFAYTTSSGSYTGAPTVAAIPAPVGGADTTAVSAGLTGLLPNSTYYYRVVATNSVGTSTGAEQSFTTATVAPLATTGAASAITSGGATLTASVNANNTSTSVTFAYGTTPALGATIAATPATATGTSATAVSAGLTGLLPNTTYYYRVLATNSAGTTEGALQSFTTAAVAPLATTGAASAITSGGATLTASVNANNTSTSVTFAYGTTPALGATIAATPATATGTSATAVSATLSGLLPNTTYYYRVRATNSAGTTEGALQSFRTAPAPAPSEFTVFLPLIRTAAAPTR